MRARDERGQVTLLITGFVVVLLMAMVVRGGRQRCLSAAAGTEHPC